jgi:hypothetical protein
VLEREERETRRETREKEKHRRKRCRSRETMMNHAVESPSSPHALSNTFGMHSHVSGLDNNVLYVLYILCVLLLEPLLPNIDT